MVIHLETALNRIDQQEATGKRLDPIDGLVKVFDEFDMVQSWVRVAAEGVQETGTELPALGFVQDTGMVRADDAGDEMCGEGGLANLGGSGDQENAAEAAGHLGEKWIAGEGSADRVQCPFRSFPANPVPSVHTACRLMRSSAAFRPGSSRLCQAR